MEIYFFFLSSQYTIFYPLTHRINETKTVDLLQRCHLPCTEKRPQHPCCVLVGREVHGSQVSQGKQNSAETSHV